MLILSFSMFDFAVCSTVGSKFLIFDLNEFSCSLFSNERSSRVVTFCRLGLTLFFNSNSRFIFLCFVLSIVNCFFSASMRSFCYSIAFIFEFCFQSIFQ